MNPKAAAQQIGPGLIVVPTKTVLLMIDSLLASGFWGLTREDVIERIVDQFCERRLREGDLLKREGRK